MNYETINFTNHKIYKIKFDTGDKDLILQEFRIHRKFITKTNSCDLIMSLPIRNLYFNAYKTVESIYQLELGKTIISGYQSGWLFTPGLGEHTGNFHNHLTLSPKYNEVPTNYVWTLYLETPNNCEGVEGNLTFMDNGKIFSIKPEEGFLYTFESSLLHRGEEAPKSTKNRIVVVANITFYFD